MPDELLVHTIARQLLADHDVCSAMRLRSCSKHLCERLAPVYEAAKLSRSLRWDPQLSRGCVLSRACTTLTRATPDQHFVYGVGAGLHPNKSWAAGGMLPDHGTFSWLVSIDRAVDNAGRLLIGVCDEPSTCAWGLCPFDGRLYRRSREEHEPRRVLNHAPPPDGFPDGGNTHVLYHADGARFNLDGRAQGTLVEVLVDADAGTLDFRIGVDGPRIRGLSGLPPATALRPWARLMGLGDSVTVDARADLLLPAVG